MSTGLDSAGTEGDLVSFLRTYYKEEVLELAQKYPKEQLSLVIDYGDLFTYDPDLADRYLQFPEETRDDLEAALRDYDLPVDITLSRAHVRVSNLPDEETYYPGGYSPTNRLEHEKKRFIAIEGQIEYATDVKPRVTDAAFECQRCGTMTYVPQDSTEFREPHECQGCERQGPFRVNRPQSEFVDSQMLRIKEPPERAPGGDGATIDVNVAEDLCESADAGDRVVVTGTLRLEQRTKGQKKLDTFDPYLVGEAIEVSESDYDDLEISPEEKKRAEELSNKDIFQLARDSIATRLSGDEHDTIKEALFLVLVGGVRVEYEDGTDDRGDTHLLLIGDPSTGKSTYLDAVMNISPRARKASGKGTTTAGMVGAAVQNDFGDTEWTIEGGALVQANEGVCCIDELDKMDQEVASSMHDALAKQKIPISKAGINTELHARTTVVAAANPKHGRWDNYQDYAEQMEFDGTLLSRFGLIYKLQDIPDEERDRNVGRHVVGGKEAQKARDAGEEETWESEKDVDPEPEIEHEFLRKYIALAKRQPDPRFRPPEERSGEVDSFATLIDSYVRLRGQNGYEEDAPVPVSARKLQDIHRLAEASAKARFSEWIEEEDISRAKRHVGESLRQYGQDEDGQMDIDTIETGSSKSDSDRERIIENLIKTHENDYDEPGIPREDLIEKASEEGLSEDKVLDTLDVITTQKGYAYQPQNGRYKWVGK